MVERIGQGHAAKSPAHQESTFLLMRVFVPSSTHSVNKLKLKSKCRASLRMNELIGSGIERVVVIVIGFLIGSCEQVYKLKGNQGQC